METLRRSKRTRKPTEKGQEIQDSKTKKLKALFAAAYDKWKIHAKDTKKAIENPTSEEILQELVSKTRGSSADVKQIYEDLRKHSTPDGETRHRVDTCHDVSKQIEKYASTLLEERNKE